MPDWLAVGVSIHVKDGMVVVQQGTAGLGGGVSSVTLEMGILRQTGIIQKILRKEINTSLYLA